MRGAPIVIFLVGPHCRLCKRLDLLTSVQAKEAFKKEKEKIVCFHLVSVLDCVNNNILQWRIRMAHIRPLKTLAIRTSIKKLWLWTLEQWFHLLSVENRGADLMSKGRCLKVKVMQKIWTKFGNVEAVGAVGFF